MNVPEFLNPEDEIVQKLILYPDKRWTLIMVRPRNEKSAARAFIANDIVTYLPLRTKVEKHNRGTRETLLPMFPGYVFACPTVQDRLFIQKNSAVRYLKNLSEYQETSLLVDLLKVRKCELLSKEHKLEVNPGLQPGRSVIVRRGPFKGQEVIVHKRKSALEIVVNLDFLGQNLELTFPAEDLLAL